MTATSWQNLAALCDAEGSVLELGMMTNTLIAILLAGAAPLMPTTQLAMQEPSDEQELLPNTAVFFLPESSTLSPLARDIVAGTARKWDAGTIVTIHASHDKKGGESAQTALLRAIAVRDELTHAGVSSPAIRTLVSDVAGVGIEARCVVVSLVRVRANLPPGATS